MGIRKNYDQEWTDVALPGMEWIGKYDPPPTKKARDFTDIARYRRHTTMTVGCQDCADERNAGKRPSIEYAAFYRTFNDDPQRWLCFLHAREWKHRDQLAGRKIYG